MKAEPKRARARRGGSGALGAAASPPDPIAKALAWASSQTSNFRPHALDRNAEVRVVVKALLEAWADGAQLSWASMRIYLEQEHSFTISRTALRDSASRIFPELVARIRG